MMHWRQIEWDKPHLPLSERELGLIEAEIGYPFPDDFRECIRFCHGAWPAPSGFSVVVDGMKIGVGVGALMDFSEGNSIVESDEAFEEAGDFLEGLVPFAEEGGGCFTCFYYPPVPANAPPFVVFWARDISQENEFIYLAPSFSEFLDILSDEPDPDLAPPLDH